MPSKHGGDYDATGDDGASVLADGPQQLQQHNRSGADNGDQRRPHLVQHYSLAVPLQRPAADAGDNGGGRNVVDNVADSGPATGIAAGLLPPGNVGKCCWQLTPVVVAVVAAAAVVVVAAD